jgi:hypothetical protein
MRKLWPITLAACLCGFTPETSDVSGWQFVRSLPIDAPLHGVGTAHAPLPVGHGETSLRFEVRPGDCSRGKHGWNDCDRDRERTELKQKGYQHHGETWWYGFSLYVPKDHIDIWPAKLSFAQFHQEGAKPAIMFKNHKGGLWLDIHDDKRTIKLIELIPASRLAGRWHDVELEIRWSRENDGYIRAWVEGVPAAQYDGATMNAEKVYFKFGLYRSHLKRNPRAAEIRSLAYFDNVARARSRNGLRPSN